MKNIRSLLLTTIALLASANLYGQHAEYLPLTSTNAKKIGETVVIETTLDLDRLDLHSKQMMILTPILSSNDGVHSYVFDPIVIMGRNRHKAIRRAEVLNGFRFDPTPQQTIVRTKKNRGNRAIHLEAPYLFWMDDAQLSVDENIYGCRLRELAAGRYTVLQPLFASLPAPVPAAVKTVTSHVHLNFPVDSYVILRDFMDNAAELAEVDRILSEMQSDETITIGGIRVTGYASPEGDPVSNVRLSEHRTDAFATYLHKQYGIPEEIIEVNWMGEDWDGLRRAVVAASWLQLL